MRLWHQGSSRRALFLDNHIKHGRNNGRVIDIVRRMVGEGEVLALMGSHELNALQFATPNLETGAPLRPD